MLVAGIAIAILSTVFALGAELKNFFGDIGNALEPLTRCAEVGSNCEKNK